MSGMKELQESFIFISKLAIPGKIFCFKNLAISVTVTNGLAATAVLLKIYKKY